MSSVPRLIPFRIPPQHADYLRTLAGVGSHDPIPKALEELYISAHRICNKLGKPVSLDNFVLIGFLAGVGMEAPPAPTMLQLYQNKVVAKDSLIEARIRTGENVNDDKGQMIAKFEWVRCRITGYTPSKGFTVRTDPGGIRHEVKHTDTRLIEDEPVKE